VPIPETNYKHSNNIFFTTSIALICARVFAQLLQPLAQSLIVSPGTARSLEDETRNAELNVIEILNGGEMLINLSKLRKLHLSVSSGTTSN